MKMAPAEICHSLLHLVVRLPELLIYLGRGACLFKPRAGYSISLLPETQRIEICLQRINPKRFSTGRNKTYFLCSLLFQGKLRHPSLEQGWKPKRRKSSTQTTCWRRLPSRRDSRHRAGTLARPTVRKDNAYLHTNDQRHHPHGQR